MSIRPPNINPDKTHFYRCLRRVEQDVLRMGSLVEESFRLSHQCLFDRNIDAGKKITALDKQIDKYYHQIEIDCGTLITLQSPVAQELRMLTAFMQLVRDLERIGDYAKDLAEIAVKLFPYPPHPSMGEIAAMSQHAQLMLATSLVALTELDAKSGQAIKQLDDTVDDAYEQLYQAFAYQQNIRGVLEPILLLVLVIRHLERMADHATNIGQRVFYIVTGIR
ncbi:MAG: phosphate signaling complex protein PhoU [Gomphosphaeria aponina SAG 52.96 = DSM 107014]|uniref:Phosphate-specific transport system accessory protein PhoU n=1 Tax=Gomphosphaeria aponina SAG 52.96 = DSM 107014 TaxID=1521640 RepID=A0A941GQ12_9CHRO|nr:phosphate signaling complex protein PhoU [Gomphosphaeria aponina SAG 52.96 = DSM 107014]